MASNTAKNKTLYQIRFLCKNDIQSVAIPVTDDTLKLDYVRVISVNSTVQVNKNYDLVLDCSCWQFTS